MFLSTLALRDRIFEQHRLAVKVFSVYACLLWSRVVDSELWRTRVMMMCEDGMLVFHWGWKSPALLSSRTHSAGIYVWISRFPYLFRFSIILFIFILDFKIILKTFELSLYSLDSNSKYKDYELSLMPWSLNTFFIHIWSVCVCLCVYLSRDM